MRPLARLGRPTPTPPRGWTPARLRMGAQEVGGDTTERRVRVDGPWSKERDHARRRQAEQGRRQGQGQAGAHARETLSQAAPCHLNQPAEKRA